MERHKYLIIFSLITISLALIIKNRDIVKDGYAPKYSFGGLYSALHPLETYTDDGFLIKEDDKKENQKPAVPKPYITAESYLVGNLETGEIYVSHDPEHVFPIASVSKLFTALIARHVTDPEKKITITQPMLDAYGDAGHLVLDEVFTPDELLYPLVLESSNDAAEAFAQAYGYPEFIEEMNAFAEEIDMNKTSFKDASGLNPGNSSNAKDLFTLTQYLYKNEKPLLEATSKIEMSVATTSDHEAHRWISINPLSKNPYFIGGKTGRTNEALESMVSLFSYPSKGETYPIAIIVLRSSFREREIDTGKLFAKFMTLIGAN
jgi:D-alanyl-D-alanine carboxypeptidase